MIDLSKYGIRVLSLTEYEVQSSRHPGVWYRVKMAPADSEKCECPATVKECRHIKKCAFVGLVIFGEDFEALAAALSEKHKYGPLATACLRARLDRKQREWELTAIRDNARKRQPERERVAA